MHTFLRFLLAASLCQTAFASPATLDLNGQRVPLRVGLENFSQRLDKDGDGFLSDAELEKGLKQAGRLLVEFKYAFTDTRLPERALYPDYAHVQARLEAVAQAHPECAQLVELGRSHEGRTLWALRLGYAPAGTKPAVVITGGTHAREWASVALPLQLADTLLAAESRSRLENGEIWIVPLLNPDGYEYSRDHDNSYRKNRRPEEGVDLNRNYSDPAHPELYRNADDQPDSNKDDVGASDRPSAETYRGPSGSSEPEVQAMMQLELHHPNVVGVLDNHGHGNWLLRPATAAPDEYDGLARVMNAAAGQLFKYRSADQLYPMTGNSLELLEAHGILAVTLEIGVSFQPPQAELEKLLGTGIPANLAFIDEALKRPGVSSKG